MPIALLIIGAIMLVAGIRGQAPALGDLWQEQFTGGNNFLTWAFVLVTLGGFGFFRELKPVSRAFMVLVLIVLLLTNSRNTETGSILGDLQKAILGSRVDQQTTE